MKALPDLSLENKFENKIIAGIDEAGRGPLVGPVVAAAVVLNRNFIPAGINDSKKLSAKKREGLYESITKNHEYGIGIADIDEIEKYNILEATKLAMIRAFCNLSSKVDVVLIDGNSLPSIDCEKYAIVKGDSISLSIAAASIIAKVTRDKLLQEFSLLHPEYGWDRNSGYGTKSHIEAIHKFGVTKFHRRSFEPIKTIISKL